MDNLGLETIVGTDNVSTDFVRKLNSNMNKLDVAYGLLVEHLLEKTGKDNLAEAIDYVDSLAKVEGLTATPDKILNGYTAVVDTGKITGTFVPNERQVINVTLTGTNTSYISGYGAGIDQNGKLVIWAMSNSSTYEHIYFVNTSIGAGTIAEGWNISSFDTSDPIRVPHACTITGLGNYNTINITLEATSTNATYDYVRVNVTITAS